MTWLLKQTKHNQNLLDLTTVVKSIRWLETGLLQVNADKYLLTCRAQLK